MSKTQIFVAAAAIFWVYAGCSRQQQQEAAPPAEAAASGKPGSSRSTATAPAAKHPARPLTLAEGTVLRVRSTTELSTKTQKPGEVFTATLEEPLMAGDRLVAPKGATVEGQVVESDPGGRVKGRAEISVRLTRLHLDHGRSVEIHTNTVAHEAHSTKGKDAAKIGIGSGVGAAIGAIAGGGKGAAIGAAAGAGAGAGTVLATHGDAAVIPSESVLQFELRSPVTVSR